MMARLTYKDSGVDVRKADHFVRGINGFLTSSALSEIAAFGCPFDLGPALKKYKNPVLVSSTDGVGTKLKIAQVFGSHGTVGIDLVGMNVNDVICLGAQPLFFLDYVACGRLKPKILHAVVRGIHAGLLQAGCALIGGETAEMPGMYDENEYDLAGFCVGMVERNAMVTGSRMLPGDIIIGLASSGLHSNGFSLARRALGARGMRKYSAELLAPTRIYVKPILRTLASLRAASKTVKGIAHITGGAFYSKATKIVPSGLGMVVRKGSWPVPDIFKRIQEYGAIEEREMYSVFNMGIGMMMVVTKKQAESVVKKLTHQKCKSWAIGEIVKSDTKMRIE
ncbi:MAG: phosphoribosylformylglycinamidine cyclo-ligase [Candidatus Omnitrophota bacterium]|nr:phosphoribosylformylglycinamidine cyclo-ligase [Candidatus Omnitrophota bacterium]